MLLAFYNLREQPFGVTPDPRFLYTCGSHGTTMAALSYGIQANLGFTALIAQAGMGKTTLLFNILQRFHSTVVTAFLCHTQCNSNELLEYFLQELDGSSNEQGPVALHGQIQQILVKAARSGRRVILIIDEAQNLDIPVLETVRLLSNFETPGKKLLHIILSGQPPLADHIARPEMAQLQQRIAFTHWLKPLTTDEVAHYIDHRLRVARCSGDHPFSDSALEAIAFHSEGIPRKINRICFNALCVGYALRKNTIDQEIIERALSKDGFDVSGLLEHSEESPAKGGPPYRFSVPALPHRNGGPRSEVPLSPSDGFPTLLNNDINRKPESAMRNVDTVPRRANSRSQSENGCISGRSGLNAARSSR